MDDRLEQLADTLCLTGATRVERFGKQAADLTSLAPKWKDRQHIMVALRQHLQDTQQALDTDDEQKELTDLALITDAYRRSQVGRQLLRQRMAKFRQYASSPSLADQPASADGPCLSKALAAVKADPSLRLMMGPAGNADDTAHFWTVDAAGDVIDLRKSAVPADYAYTGRQVDPVSVRAQLKTAGPKPYRLPTRLPHHEANQPASLRENFKKAESQVPHVFVTGAPGAGKTTRAKELAEERGLPLVHLDDWWDGDTAKMGNGWKRHLKQLKTPHVVEGWQLLREKKRPGEEVHLLEQVHQVLAERLADRGWNDDKGTFQQGPEALEDAGRMSDHFLQRIEQAKNRWGLQKTAISRAAFWAKKPRILKDIASMVVPGVYKGEAHTCVGGARKIRDILESRGVPATWSLLFKGKKGVPTGFHAIARSGAGGRTISDYGLPRGGSRKLTFQKRPHFNPGAGSREVKVGAHKQATQLQKTAASPMQESSYLQDFAAGVDPFGIDAGGGGVKIGEDTQYRLSPEYARRLQDLSPRGERLAMHDWLDLHTEKVAFNPFIAAGKLGLRGAGIAYRGMKSGLGLTRAQNARRVMSAMRSAPNSQHYDRIVRSAKATGVKGPSLLNPLGWMTPLSTAESRFTQAGRARWLAQQAAGNTRAWKRVAGGMTPSHARQAQQAITQSRVMAPRSVMGAPAQRMAIKDSLRRTSPNMVGYMAAYPLVFDPAKRAIGFGGGDAGGFDQEMPYAGYDEGMS